MFVVHLVSGLAKGAKTPVGLNPASRDKLVHYAVRSRTLSIAGTPFGLTATP